MYRLFNRCGLVDLAIELIPGYFTHCAVARQVLLLAEIEELGLASGLLTNQELDRWQASLDQAEGVFFASLTGVLAVGHLCKGDPIE